MNELSDQFPEEYFQDFLRFHNISETEFVKICFNLKENSISDPIEISKETLLFIHLDKIIGNKMKRGLVEYYVWKELYNSLNILKMPITKCALLAKKFLKLWIVCVEYAKRAALGGSHLLHPQVQW